MTNKKPKRYYTRTIDLIFLFILLLVGIYMLYNALTFSILPKKWILIGVIFFLMIYITLFLLSLRKTKRWIIITKRIFILVLCVLLCIPAFFLQKSKQTLNQMFQMEEKEYTEIKIITSKNSSITSLDELASHRVGFQKGSDIENSEYAKTEIKKSADIQMVEELDYTTLISQMMIGNIDALAISDNYYDMSKNNIDGFEDNIKTIATLKKKNPKTEKKQKDISKEPFVVYISGLDNMGSPDQQNRSDTNILLIVNPRANHIDMVSLPRDGYIPNTALHNENDKLTHTGMYGISASVSSIENFFGIPIDYYARVSFNSLIEIVDAMNGIDVDVEISFCEQDENRSFKKEDLICLEKGEQTLNGKQALAYSRHRKTPGYDNPGRERAQRRIINAIIDKLISPNALTYVNSLLDIAPDYVLTDMPASQIAKFISSELNNPQPWTISSISTDNGVNDSRFTASIPKEEGTSSVYLFSKEDVQAVHDAYESALHPLEMKNFQFNINTIDGNTSNINDDPNIVWDTMAITPQY